MALGFTSHYKSGDQSFGTLTQSAYNSESESNGTAANTSNLIMGQDTAFVGKNMNYDSCEFSSSVVIDYTQYANLAESSSSETAGSVAYSGGADFSSVSTSGTVSSFSGCASFSGGGMSSASFTC